MTDLSTVGSQGSPLQDISGPLADIDASLERGDIETARRLAEALARDGELGKGTGAQARAVLRLAYCDLADSRVQRAYGEATRAAGVFREQVALTDEVDALALRSRAASVLGRSVEAVEAALLATQLAGQSCAAGAWTARAHLSLGVAYGWGHAYAQAAQAFDSARQLVDRHGDVAAQLEVCVERHWIRALRWTTKRQDGKPVPRFEGLQELAQLHTKWRAQSPSSALTPGMAASLSVSASLVTALMLLWSGNTVEAQRQLVQCVSTGIGAAAAGWLLAAQSWVRAELAVEAGDLEEAAMHAGRTAALASEVGHLPLACIGLRLSGDIHVLQGRADLAATQLRQELARERAIHAQQLEARGELTAYQVAVRDGRRQIEDLTAKSTKLERWAHEDALTGIANLRRFNQCLTDWAPASSDSGRPMCVALIDVDKFKRINDDFSYETGNAVLRSIAVQMAAHVREQDLPARWGGDEFAILFRDADVGTARQVAQRIQQAVAKHDWTSLAHGLSVSISVGVTEAHPGDNRQSLVERSETAMYAEKLSHRCAEVERSVPPRILRKVANWLRNARRVVIFVGAGQLDAEGERASFGHVGGLQTSRQEFATFWSEWRRAHRARRPTATHDALVALSHRLPQTTFVTGRIDGVLGMAGADDVIELYGNAFHDRCIACDRVNASSDGGFCLLCNNPLPTLRPNVVLLGEQVDSRLLEGAELAFKRADVVLVVDCDASTFPGAGLIEKARVRSAHVVMLGNGSRTRREAADVSISAPAELVAGLLCGALDEGPPNDSAGTELSAEGFAAYVFLSGQGADTFGITLDQALTWKDWEIERHLGTLPWMFPLPTRSRMIPEAPMPTRQDYRMFATDEVVRDGFRQSFLLMLRFYGFQWHEGRVERAPAWKSGFANWAVSSSHHDLFISRILGALTLGGLREEANAFLKVLEVEVRQYRGDTADGPLWHWRLAVNS